MIFNEEMSHFPGFSLRELSIGRPNASPTITRDSVCVRSMAFQSSSTSKFGFSRVTTQPPALMFPIEVFSHLIRMGTLTIRLTANMFADHTLLAIFLSFPIIQLFIPWVVMGLGLFIAFIQAFIFSYLTMTYIGEAIAEAH